VAVDGAGNVYIADTGNNAIKKWTAASEQRDAIGILVSFPDGGVAQVCIIAYWRGGGRRDGQCLYRRRPACLQMAQQSVQELPRAFVDPTTRLETGAAGSGCIARGVARHGESAAARSLPSPATTVADHHRLSPTAWWSFSFAVNTGRQSHGAYHVARTNHCRHAGWPSFFSRHNRALEGRRLAAIASCWL
jgi:hypothetical protein